MGHVTESTLRRSLDEPEAVSDLDHDHLRTCPRCAERLSLADRDRDAARTALEGDLEGDLDGDLGTGVDAGFGAGLDVDGAWESLRRRASGGATVSTISPAARRRRSVRTPVLAAVVAVAAFGTAATAAAVDWLPIFRTEKVAPLSLSESDLARLPDLSAYGDVTMPEGPGLRRVAGAAEAESESGLAAPVVSDLPHGVQGVPAYEVLPQRTATFTFSAEKAARAVAGTGDELPPMPAGVDGSTLRAQVGPGVVEVWSRATAAVPTLIVARVTAPTASSEGVPLPTLRDYLLSIPGIPDDVAAQLRAVSADGTTLPLPVPSGQVTSAKTDVNGIPATVLTSRAQVGAMVVWVEDGTLDVVAGSLDADELLDVARGLR